MHRSGVGVEKRKTWGRQKRLALPLKFVHNKADAGGSMYAAN